MDLPHSTERLVDDACADLLASIGHRVTCAPGGDIARVLSRPREYAAGLADFKGRAMKGTVVLLAPFEFFSASLSKSGRAPLTPSSAGDWIRVRDWTMELTNQLLGRIKNGLCAFGVVVDASLPCAVSDHALVVTVRARKGACRAFRAGPYEILVWFEAAFDPAAAQEPPLEPAGEGEVITF